MGIKSLICLPDGAPISKVEATKRLGAKVCLVPGVYDDAYQKAIQLRDEHGYAFIHPFDDENVIAGQGTIGLELLDQLPDVTEDEICAAILHLIESEKMVAEGAGAASVAAVMFNKVPVKGLKTVCLVSGGNIDVTILNRVINRGLAKSGRLCSFLIELDDKPGQLVRVTQIVAEQGGNIISVHHERNADSEKVNACMLRLGAETKDEAQIELIRNELIKNGFKLV
jgi:threonine dehydratase